MTWIKTLTAWFGSLVSNVLFEWNRFIYDFKSTFTELNFLLLLFIVSFFIWVAYKMTRR